MVFAPPAPYNGSMALESREAPERVGVLADPELPDLHLLDIRHTRRAWKLFHESYVFTLVTDLAVPAPVDYRGSRFPIGPGSLSLFVPGESHRAEPRVSGSSLALFVRPERLAEAAGTPGRLPFLRKPVTTALDVVRVQRALARSLAEPASLLEREGRLERLLEVVLDRYGEDRLPRPPLRAVEELDRARRHLLDRLAEPVTLDDLAREAGMGRFQFARAFRSRFALPPHEFQLRARVARAQWLLGRGQPPAAAGAATGFADQSHFTRHFRRIFGVTPGAYADAVVRPSSGRRCGQGPDGAD